MKQIKDIAFVLMGVLAMVVLQSCNKQTDKTQSIEDKPKTERVMLLDNVVLAQKGINDTKNNIKGQLIFPINVEKRKDNINLKPATQFIIDDLHEFAAKVKEVSSPDRRDTNYYYCKTKELYEQNDIVSVLYERTSHLTGTTDTDTELLTCNYNKNTGKILNFFDYFKVDSQNLQAFNQEFKTLFTLEDLKTLSFNFTKETIWLNLYKDGKQERYNRLTKEVKRFLIDG